MLNNFWYVVEFSHILADRPILVVLMGQRFVLYRDRTGQVIALDDHCPHRGASLSQGRVEVSHIRCSYHGWKYQSDGRCIEVPANHPDAQIPARACINSYPVQEKYGFIWLFIGDFSSVDDCPPIPTLDDFQEPGFRENRNEFQWDAHYTRVMENLLDISHPAFVHSSLGQRAKQDTSIPRVTVESKGPWGAEVTLSITMANLKRLSYVPFIKRRNLVSVRRHSFRLPNLTILELDFEGWKFKVLHGHVPISEKITLTKWIGLRNYLKLPLFDKSSVNYADRLFVQDNQVIRFQKPAISPYDFQDDVMVESDSLVAAYRSLRKKYTNHSV